MVKQILQSPSHPVWSLIRLAIYIFGLTTTLWATASHFDETEIRTIITMFLVGASG